MGFATFAADSAKVVLVYLFVGKYPVSPRTTGRRRQPDDARLLRGELGALQEMDGLRLGPHGKLPAVKALLPTAGRADIVRVSARGVVFTPAQAFRTREVFSEPVGALPAVSHQVYELWTSSGPPVRLLPRADSPDMGLSERRGLDARSDWSRSDSRSTHSAVGPVF